MSSKFARSLASQSCVAATLVALGAPVAYAQEQTYKFDIPAQSIDAALLSFGRQSHQQVVFDGATVQGMTSTAVEGQYTAPDALKTLLAGTGLASLTGGHGEFIVTASREAQPDKAIEVGGIVVTGRLNQIAKTIQAKRTSDVVSDGVASDEISSIPEFGLGDALARVPGVVFQINNGRGEDQFMTLRGLNGDYGSTTVDGMALATSEETTRQT
jgi:type II secretory pathway component GspD/PulD (secretin)